VITGRAEKHFKRLVKQLNLQWVYDNRIECFRVCNNELTELYNAMNAYESECESEIDYILKKLIDLVKCDRITLEQLTSIKYQLTM